MQVSFCIEGNNLICLQKSSGLLCLGTVPYILPSTEREALEWSIEKWRYLSQLDYESRSDFFQKVFDNFGQETCAICLFSEGTDCVTCLINKATHNKQCRRTPYYRYRDALGEGRMRAAKKSATTFYNLLLRIYVQTYGSTYQGCF